MREPHAAWRLTLVSISVVLFATALTQPAFFWGASASSSGPAMRVLLQGWRAPLHGYVEWLANPLLIIGWIATLRGYGRVAQATAWATVAAMLGFLFRHKLPLPEGGAITSYGPGYWLWVLSGLTLLLAQRRGLPGRSSTILSSEKSARIF